MKTCIIIPARFASTRYPGKPLVMLDGKDGSKSLIQRTWEKGIAVMDEAHVYVATDDERIEAHVQGFGGQVIMTSSNCQNGTERCAEAIDKIGNYDLVVNLQGDAPLTPPWFVKSLINDIGDADVATPVLRCDQLTYNRFTEDRRNGLVGGTTAVFDKNCRGLYFSKEVIPYLPTDFSESQLPVYHHVGVYAYKPSALAQYTGWGASAYELCEGLEQLRFIENGAYIKCVEVDARGSNFWELNNPVDVERIESEL